MASVGRSNIHLLSPEQTRELVELRERAAVEQSPHVLRALARQMGEVIKVKAAILARQGASWTVVAESHPEPRLVAGADAWYLFDRCAAGLEGGARVWHEEAADWTLLCTPSRPGASTLLVLEGDWTLSTPLLDGTARSAASPVPALKSAHPAEPQRVPEERAGGSRPDLTVSLYRLARDLGRVSGPEEIGATILHHAVRAVPSRLAALAVATTDDWLAITATHGYPKALVEDLRIAPGSGIIGSVYLKRAPLRVTDARTVRGAPRRARYRTNSFVALPVMAGAEALGVLCVTDRADDRPFTRRDVSVLRALLAPAGLALAAARTRQLAAKFAHAAIIDPVSGLFNRRHLSDRLEEELQRSQRQQTPITLLMIDIDDFKAVNDRFGHVTGDTMIREVSTILRRSVRRFDVCVRYGGEEFIVLMPAGPDIAARVAERLRRAVEAFRPRRADCRDLRITISIGAASVHGGGGEDLIERADRALYEAKRAGKNCVRGFEPDGVV